LDKRGNQARDVDRGVGVSVGVKTNVGVIVGVDVGVGDGVSVSVRGIVYVERSVGSYVPAGDKSSLKS
jgi:hypothetical protein